MDINFSKILQFFRNKLDNISDIEDVKEKYLSLCVIQAKLFQYVYKHDYSMYDFTEKFLISDFCNIVLDSRNLSQYKTIPSSLFRVLSHEFRERLMELQKKQEQEFCTSADAAYDIGFGFRLLQIAANVPSRELCKPELFSSLQDIITEQFSLPFYKDIYKDTACMLCQKFKLPIKIHYL